jgi:hypothetical protein
VRQVDVFRALLHDAPGPGPAPDLAAHAAALERAEGWAVGPLVVPDDRLSGLTGGVALSVVTGSGAGSVAALARRSADLHLVGVETTLRDLDDLAGNAARVVAAAGELPDGVEVFVGVPTAAGALEAVEVVEAAGLLGRVDVGAAGRPGAGDALSVLVEADLPFKVTGLGPDPLGPYGVVALLMALEALVDGADPADADALLTEVDPGRAAAGLAGWDGPTQARVRRRLRGADCADVATTLDRLAAAGLLSG